MVDEVNIGIELGNNVNDAELDAAVKAAGDRLCAFLVFLQEEKKWESNEAKLLQIQKDKTKKDEQKEKDAYQRDFQTKLDAGIFTEEDRKDDKELEVAFHFVLSQLGEQSASLEVPDTGTLYASLQKIKSSYGNNSFSDWKKDWNDMWDDLKIEEYKNEDGDDSDDDDEKNKDEPYYVSVDVNDRQKQAFVKLDHDLEEHLQAEHVNHCKDALFKMRRLERLPTTCQRGGFVYKIDNLCARFLFPQLQVQKPNKVKVANYDEKEVKEPLKKDPSTKKVKKEIFKKQTSVVCFYGFFLIMVIVLGTIGVGSTWWITAFNSLGTGIANLNLENLERMDTVGVFALSSLPLVASYVQASVSFQTGDAFTGTATENFFVDQLLNFNISGAYFIDTNNKLIGAVYTGGERGETVSTSDVKIVEANVASTDNCVYEFVVGAGNVRTADPGVARAEDCNFALDKWFPTDPQVGGWKYGDNLLSGKGTVYYTPFFNGTTFVGLVGLDLRYDFLDIKLKEIGLGDANKGVIVDADGAIVAASVDHNNVQVQEAVKNLAYKVESGDEDVVNFNISGTDKFCQTVDMPDQTIVVCVKTLENNLTANLNDVDQPFNTWKSVIIKDTSLYQDVISKSTLNTALLGLAALFFAMLLTYYSWQLVKDTQDYQLKMQNLEEEFDNSKKAALEKKKKEKEEKEEKGDSGDESDKSKSSKASEEPDKKEREDDEKKPEFGRKKSLFASFKRKHSSQSTSKLYDKLKIIRLDQVKLNFDVKGNRRNSVIVISLLLLFLCLLGMWSVWSSRSESTMDIVKSELVSGIETRIFGDMEDYMGIPNTINQLHNREYARGNLQPYNASSEDRKKYDAYFHNMMQGITANMSNGFVSFVFAGFPTGEFSGATWRNDQFLISARDNFTETCYELFQFDKTTQTRGTEIPNECNSAFATTARPWYVKAVKAKKKGWIQYLFADGTIGLTNYYPVYTDETKTTLFAVFGVDVRIKVLNEFLGSIFAISKSETGVETSKPLTFVVERNSSALVASSANEPVILTSDDEFFTPEYYKDEMQSRAFTYLNNIKVGEGTVITTASPGVTAIRRPLTDPITSIKPLEIEDLDWVAIVCLPRENFDFFATNLLLSFLISGGTVIIMFYLIFVSFKSFKKKVLNQGGFDHIFSKTLVEERPEKQDLKAFITNPQFRNPIIEACIARYVSADTVYNAPNFSDFRQHCSMEAIKHMKDSQKDRDILTICRLQLLDVTRPDVEALHLAKFLKGDAKRGFREKFYANTQSVYYRSFLLIITFLHVFLLFLKPNTLDELERDGVRAGVAILELLCLIVEVVEGVIKYQINYKWITMTERKSNPLISNSDTILDIIYFVLVGIFCVDWLVMITGRFSLEYRIPLRGFLLILVNKGIRLAAVNFLKTLYRSRNVFLLYFSVVLVAAEMGIVLFRDVLGSPDPESSYSNFIQALTTSFVYITTGENYGEVVYTTVDAAPWHMIYWVTFCLLGMFFVLAIVVANFEDGFKEMREKEMVRTRLFKRTGIMAAFILLDLDFDRHNPSIDKEEFADLVVSYKKKSELKQAKRGHKQKSLFSCCFKKSKVSFVYDEEKNRRETEKMVGDLFGRLNDDGDNQINIAEFVTGIEQINIERLIVAVTDSKGRAKLRRMFERSWWKRLVLLVVLTNLWLFSMYGTYDKEWILDFFLVLILLLYVLELSLRLYTFGVLEFFWYSDYHKDNDRQELTNRFEFFLIVTSFLSYIASRFVEGGFWFESDTWRFSMTFVLLRIFSVIERTRSLVYTLLRLLPRFTAVALVLFVICYIYAVIGVIMFAGEFALLQDEAPGTNFDSISSALLTLFQLLIGEGWHDLMHAAIKVKYTFAYGWYFISYIVIVSTLFANVFTGIVLDAVAQEEEEKQEERNKKKEEQRKKKQEERRKKNMLKKKYDTLRKESTDIHHSRGESLSSLNSLGDI